MPRSVNDRGLEFGLTLDDITIFNVFLNRQDIWIKIHPQKLGLHADIFVQKKIFPVQTNDTPAAFFQSLGTANMIQMGMGMNDVGNLQTSFGKGCSYVLTIITGINHHGSAGFFIANDGAIALKRPYRKSFHEHGNPLYQTGYFSYFTRVKIYTRTGDDGSTALFDGTRVMKTDDRVEAYGEVDELNAAIGLALSFIRDRDLRETLFRIQRELFALGARLANPSGKKQPEKSDFNDAMITRLENEIDTMEGALWPMKNFILPGGSSAAAALHLARTICRRAERRILDLAKRLQENSGIEVRYVNRLSDHLFVCARFANHLEGTEDIPW